MTVLLGTLAVMIVGPFYALFNYPLITIGIPVGFVLFYKLFGKLFKWLGLE